MTRREKLITFSPYSLITVTFLIHASRKFLSIYKHLITFKKGTYTNGFTLSCRLLYPRQIANWENIYDKKINFLNA